MDQKLLKQLLDEIHSIKKALANVVTKNDVKNFLTKNDTKNFLTKADAKNFATKDDINAMGKRLTKEIREAEAFAIITADKHKAEKTVVDDLEKRVTKIERKLVV